MRSLTIAYLILFIGTDDRKPLFLTEWGTHERFKYFSSLFCEK